MKQIKKILVANRGEVAVRIIRAIREMDLKSAVVYSDADRDSLAVQLADEAYYIGPSPARDSYLKIKNIIEAAHLAGVDAVHPGYGFLAENPVFAEAVRSNGFIFIGPSTEAIKTMGCKLLSRSIMERAGVPVVPGAMAAIKDREDMFATARHIGYPLLLKSSGGGGGKGMRKVDSEKELARAYELARNESFSSFGTNTIYMEKYIKNPHHIEVQILADMLGTTVSLGERECSVQRRYQKLLEESPSPFLDHETRSRLAKIAIMAAKTVHYVNAGTVEFIVDENRNCYFLEMNTRLQVEHAVTEMVTGIDIVKEQIRIARGEPLSFTQDHVLSQGTAIECRIYAEDPDNNFMPSPGTVVCYHAPGGSGVRSDSGVFAGSDISFHYDPLISKLVTWGRTRDEGISRMKRALLEYKIEGVKTNIAYFSKILENGEFLSGNYTTSLVENMRLESAAAAAIPAYAQGD